MALITIKVDNATADDRAAVLAAWAKIPNVSSGDSYKVLFDKKANNAPYQMGTETLALPTKVVDPANKIILACSPGHSFRDNVNVRTNRYAYVPDNGVALTFVNYNKDCLVIDSDYAEVEGLQIANTHSPWGDGTVLRVLKDTSVVKNCIIQSAHHGASSVGVHCMGDAYNTLVISLAAYSIGFVFNAGSLQENCLAVRDSARVDGGGFGFTTAYNTAILHNCASFNFSKFTEYANIQLGSNNATDKAVMPFGANSKANLVYADQFVSTTGLMDFRTKTGSALIDAGSPPDESNMGDGPSGPRQMGTSVDIGSWEFPSTLQSPTATVTSIVVTGRKVVISGTTTGNPTTASTVSLVPSGAPYNGAEARAAIPMVIGAGTFSATFDLLMVGEYAIDIVASNTAYTVPGDNPLGGFQIVGPTASNVVQELDVQVLELTFTVSGNPTSGMFVLPAADVPKGATDREYPVVFNGANGSVTGVVPPGDYKKGILRLTNAWGTSMPQEGTSPISIKSFSGSSQVPETTEVVVPKVTAVVVTPETAIVESGGSVQLSAVVNGENSPGQAVTWSTPKGTVSSTGVFTGHQPTINESVTVTARSIADNTFSDTCVITVKAKVVVVPVDPDPTPEPEVPTGKATKAILDMVSPEGVPQANLTGLSVVFFDQTDVGDLLAPVARTKVGSTNSQGQLVMNITGTALVPGQSGRIVVAKGTKAFTGIVVVS